MAKAAQPPSAISAAATRRSRQRARSARYVCGLTGIFASGAGAGLIARIAICSIDVTSDKFAGIATELRGLVRA